MDCSIMLSSDLTDKDSMIIWLSLTGIWVHPSWRKTHLELDAEDYVIGIIREGIFHYVDN